MKRIWLVLLILLIPAFALAADPLSTGTGSTESAWDMVKQFGPIWGGMLLGFGLASKFLAENAKEHWLSQGRVLAFVTGAVGVLGTLLQMHFGNGSSAALIVTLLGAAKLAMSPTVATSPVPSSGGQGGFVRLELVAIMIAIGAMVGIVSLAACQTPEVKNAEHAGLAAGEVCAKQDARAILQPLEGQGVTLLGKVSAALIAGAAKTAIDDGVAQAKADLGTVPTAIETSVVDCAIKTAIGAFSPLVTGHGFAGGDARLTAAATIGQRLLAEHGIAPQ